MSEVADAIRTFPIIYDITQRELYRKVLDDLKNGTVKEIDTDLYEAYGNGLRKAVDTVLGESEYGDEYFDMQMQMRANVSRFAAYKAYHATQELKDIDVKDIDNRGRLVLNKYNRWQAAEYNTAVARARTAKQYHDFTSDPVSNELYPNIKWLPSRSATPREAHRVFWNRVWAKNDPFWNSNTPGSLWNCKCDWEETDEPVTNGNPTGNMSAKGLEGNPAVTGEIFTKDCPYVKCIGLNRKQRDAVEGKCEIVNQSHVVYKNKSLQNDTSKCTVNGKEYEVVFEQTGIEHYARDCFGNKDLFWVKNEILSNIGDYISKAQCTAKKESDTTHNTNKKTLRLKKQTDYFYYFPIMLPNGKSAVLHLGRYNANKVGKEGKMYLYSITKNMPDNTETP